MRTIETDVVIIGAGTAGLNARRAVEAAGKRWVMVEGAAYGTMCARVGCMPSKLLIAAGERMHDIAQADLFGIKAAGEVDGAAVLERVRRERDRFVGFVVEANEQLPKEQNLFGVARFVGPTSVVVEQRTEGLPSSVDDAVRVDAKAVVIAVGTSPSRPEQFDVLGDLADTNESVFERAELPKRLAVIGTGVIGLEIGQAMHRLGVKTRFFSRHDHFGGLTDPGVHDSARAILRAELDVCIAPICTVERIGDEARLTSRTSNGDRVEVFDRVLIATGRHPNVGRLDLAAAGIAVDERGAPVFDAGTLRCGDANVFVAGDITGTHPLLHEAVDDGRIAGTNAARLVDGGALTAATRRVPMAITFCDPNIAVVGERWSPEHAVGEVDFGRQGRSRVMGKNAGVTHVYGRRADRRLIGAEMCGPRVEHLAHLVAWAIQSGLTVEQTLALPFYHPVVEEGLRTALQDLAKNLDSASRDAWRAGNTEQ